MDAAEVIETLEANHRNSALHLGQRERVLIEFSGRYLQRVVSAGISRLLAAGHLRARRTGSIFR